MSTLIDIEEVLKTRVKEATQELQLKNKSGEYQNINVITGLLPPKESYKKISDYPFVIVRTHISDDDKENSNSIQNFVLYFGVCAEEESYIPDDDEEEFSLENYQNGHKDLTNLYEKVRLNFLQKSSLYNNGSLQGTIKKLKFEAFLEQPFPYFIGQLDLKIESDLIEEDIDG